MNTQEKPSNTCPYTQIASLKEENLLLKEKLAWLERQVFGRRTERYVEPNPSQQLLPGMEDVEKEHVPLEMENIPTHKRKKKRKAKNDYSQGLLIPENLPVEQTILDLPQEEKVCSQTGQEMLKIGEAITRKLAYRSAEFFIKEIIRPQYALPSQEEAGVFYQELPSSILPKSRADESLLAHLIVEKFADHLPCYRLSEKYLRMGVQLPRQLISQWLVQLGKILSPLVDLQLGKIHESGVVYIDESPVKFQVKGKGKLQQGYMWVVSGGLGGDPPHRVYRFFENRKHQNAEKLLKDFRGIFHSDKYEAYEKLAQKEGVLWQPCWVHIRRYFEKSQVGDKDFSSYVLRKIRHLFMYERVAWARDPGERLRIRQEKEAPIIDELIEAVKKKVKNSDFLPKSNLGAAIQYLYTLIPYLKNYHKHPHARMDNNVAERTLRCLAIGRKNWQFFGSGAGGESAAVLFTLVQSCRSLGINPQEYLEDIMRRFKDHPFNRLEELLPEKWAIRRASTHPPSNTQPIHVR